MDMKALRQTYHTQICAQIINIDTDGAPNFADKSNGISVELAKGIVKRIHQPCNPVFIKGQTAGKLFEKVTVRYLEEAFQKLDHLRPGEFSFQLNRHVEEFE